MYREALSMGHTFELSYNEVRVEEGEAIIQSTIVNILEEFTQSKKRKFRHLESHKKGNITVDLLSLGIYAPGPQVLTYRPQILRRVRI